MINTSFFHIDFRSEKEDEIEEYYRKKYAESTAAERGYEDAGDCELPEEIAQQTLLPSVK